MSVNDANAHQSTKKLKSSLTLLPPQAVLDDEYCNTNVDLLEVYIGKVRHKSDIGVTLARLKSLLPVPSSLAHLKRVRRDEIILAPVADIDREECVRLVAKVPRLESAVCTCQVPAVAPKTKAQHRDANSYWPCNFHPTKLIEQLLAHEFFSYDDLQMQRRHMQLAVDAARRNRSPVAAVVVDPKSNGVVAITVDERQRNPSHHAVMQCLEKVAELQRILFRDDGKSSGKSPVLMMECVDQGQQGLSLDQIDDAGVSSGGGGSSDDELPYLCTGYDVYVTREPCIMCAMAMVHSRVRSVFYGCSTEHGALGSKCKLHRERQLNHRYLAFKNLMEDECRTLETFRNR